MNTIPVLSDLSWLPGTEQWWVAAAGVLATALAFLVGTRVFGTSQRSAAKGVPAEGEHDPFSVGSKTERRVAHRRRGSCVGVLITDAEQKMVEREGWVLDRSLGGLGLFSEIALEAGKLMRVKPENAPALMPWIDVEVKECKPHETGYHLNCAFVKTPPYSVLLLFG